MTEHATKVRPPRQEENRSSSSRSKPAAESNNEQLASVPAYLGGNEQIKQAAPNFSQVENQQSSYDETISSELCSMPLESASSTETEAVIPEAAPASEVTTEQQSTTETENQTAAAEEMQQSEDTIGTEESTAETTEEQPAEETEEAEAQAASETSSEQIAQATNSDITQQRGNIETAKKGRDTLVAILPGLSPIRTPYVPSPPTAAILRREEIIKRSGSPPEYHHALVRQGVERTAQAARDAQRRMLFNIGNLGLNTRISIEEMADEVLAVTGAAVKQINDAVDQSMCDIEQATVDEMDHIETYGVLTGDELQASRDEVMLDITAQLAEGSESIQRASEIAEGRFDEKLPIAEASIMNIPLDGLGEPLPMPPAPQSAAGGSNNAPSENEQPESTPPGEGTAGADTTYHTVDEAYVELSSFIDTQSGYISGSLNNVKTYLLSRSTPVLEGVSDREQTTMVQNAQQRAEQAGSEANKAQFSTLVLSLTTPVSQHHEEDQSESVSQSNDEGDLQLTESEIATRNANNILLNKCEQAKKYADRDMRDTLTKNIQKSGQKAHDGLQQQAGSAEIALNNSAAQMAEAYRDLVKRIDALLPAEQFLDSRLLLPKLLDARESAKKLQQQHEQAAQMQADATLEQMDKVKRDQIKSIAKAGRDSADSMQDVVTRSRFDMSMFASQMTGYLSDGALQGMDAAREYAERMAEGILKSVDDMDGKALLQIDQIAVGFLNGAISSAEQGQYLALAGFVREMEKIGEQGQLTRPMSDARADLERRASAIDNAMPGQSLATAGGLMVLSPIAAGVYLYCTDADEDVVIQNMGNLMWPGALALEDVFNSIYTSPSLLRPRIESEMGNPEKGHALALLSRSALVRGQARLDIANYSTGWFDYNREARESALQGLSAAEQQALNSLDPSLIEDTRNNLISDLNDHQGEIASAYLDRNRERAVAARTRESLDKARGQGEWGWIFSAESAQRRSDEARVEVMANMQGVLQRELSIETAYVPQDVMQASTQRVYSEFASLTDPRQRRAEAFSTTEAQQAMINYATSPHIAVVQGLAKTSVEHINMSDVAQRYINDLVTHGADSDQARVSRGVYEFRRAEGDSTLGIFDDLSETSQNRLSDAFENRQLATLERQVAEARNPQERSRYQRLLAEERIRHRARLQQMAAQLGAPENIRNNPESAELWMAQRVGGLFAREDDLISNRPSHARYGTEMITHGRASLVAGVQLATEGAGTNEDLLRRAYGDRSHREIAAANAQWSRENEGENMEEMLGIRQRSWDASDYALFAASPLGWFAMRGAETSGDLAMELERLSLGNRETDLDHLRYAGLQYNQERVRGTGFIASSTMQGTPEQQSLDGRRDRLASLILAEAQRHNPRAAAAYQDNPGALFRPDGSIDPAIQAAAFNRDGSFLGNNAMLQHYTQSVSLAADSYRNEIDRQEKMLTTGITVLALVASIALMCIPGVNLVVAGVIAAVIAGAATIAVKAGMRGERYGWEEAATDIATTAIEAASAGFGGAIAGGLGKAGGLARIGAALNSRLGVVGSAIVRESLVSAISSGAQVALQDEVWKDGLGRGLERVMNGAIKGAAVAAVTAGVSESLSGRLNKSMLPGDIDPSNFSRMQNIGRALGPNGSAIFRESVSEMLGSVAGETVGVLTDYATGQFQGKFGDALKRIGQAGLRDMVSGAMRTSVMNMNRARYRNLLDAARRGDTLGPADVRALRLAAISAGAMNYDDGPARVRAEIDEGRLLLSQLPVALREHAAGMDLNTMREMIHMLDAGDLGNAQQRSDFLRDLSESMPGINGRALMQELDATIASRRPADQAEIPDPAQQTILRNKLSAGMDAELRPVLDEVRVDGLEHLPDADLRLATEMIARGKFDSQTADALYRQAKQENPDLSEYTFLRNLFGAVEISRQAQQLKRMETQQRHRDVMAAVPENGRRVFADLADESIKQIKQLLDQESTGTAHVQEALFREARQRNPELTHEQFQRFLESAVANVKSQKAEARHQAQIQRQKTMSNVPEHLRGTLSVLPDAALIDLHLRQMQGELSPADRLRLETAALKENPDVDLATFHQALKDAVQHGTPIRPSADEVSNMRQELLSGIPEAQRSQLGNVPILVMRAGDFEAFTRSTSGKAVTLILHGEPVVVIRECADPRVLREEGIHALQSKDPRWSERMGALDESHLQRWDELPLEQQMALYRDKIDIEINAHDRMIDGLADQLRRSSDPQDQARLRSQLEMAQATLTNLNRRQAEVAAIGPMQRMQIDAGLLPRPQWLDQPARLFGKGEQPSEAPVPKTRDELNAALTADLAPDGTQARETRKLLDAIDVEQLNRLAALELSPADMRKVIRSHEEPELVHGMIAQLNKVANAIPKDQRGELLSTLISKHDFVALIPLLQTTIQHAPDTNSAQQLLSAILHMPGNHVESANSINHYISQASPDQRHDFTQLLSSLGGDGRSRLLNLLGDMHTTVTRLKPDNSDYNAAIAGIIRAAGSGDVGQRVDLINRTQKLLNALADLPDTPERRKVINHVMDGLTRGDDLVAHALDLRAASRLLKEGKIPDDIFKRFHETIDNSGTLTGGDAFQLHLSDKMAAWPEFRNARPDFSRMLEDSTPHLTESQRAALADMEPWFTHIVNSEWFKARIQQSGNSVEVEQRLLLEQIIKKGLRDQSEIKDFDTLRHIMQEIRLTTIDLTGEPDLNAMVRQEMQHLGLSEPEITRRQQEFEKLLAENRAALGREAPEVHLENLIRQRIEYQQMIDTAKQIAKTRFPNDSEKQQALVIELTRGLQQKVTETIGEIAATRAISTDPRFDGFHLQTGFEPGIGFDQVWVRYGPDGKVSEIMIVEAKGPGATTQQTHTKGAQMSAEWIASTASQMILRGDKTGVGTLLLEAIETGHPPVAGIIVQAKDRTGTPGEITRAPGTNPSDNRYDVNDLNRHLRIRTTASQIQQSVLQRISELNPSEYTLRYSDDELARLVRLARDLKLSDNEIRDLLLEGSRNNKPVSTDSMIKMMNEFAKK